MSDEKDKPENKIVEAVGHGRFIGDFSFVRVVKRNQQGEVLEDKTYDFDADDKMKERKDGEHG